MESAATGSGRTEGKNQMTGIGYLADSGDMMDKLDSDTGKIVMATLAGLGAGIAAGILLAPDSGRTTRDSVMRSFSKAGDEVNSRVRKWTDSLRGGEDTGQDEQLVMHGSWEDVKSQLRANYAELTEEDLTYQQGGESELLERLQRRLGKTRDEIVRLITGK